MFSWVTLLQESHSYERVTIQVTKWGYSGSFTELLNGKPNFISLNSTPSPNLLGTLLINTTILALMWNTPLLLPVKWKDSQTTGGVVSVVTLSFTCHAPPSSPGTNHHAMSLSIPCVIALISAPSTANLRKEGKAKHFQSRVLFYHEAEEASVSGPLFCTISFQGMYLFLYSFLKDPASINFFYFN